MSIDMCKVEISQTPMWQKIYCDAMSGVEDLRDRTLHWIISRELCCSHALKCMRWNVIGIPHSSGGSKLKFILMPADVIFASNKFHFECTLLSLCSRHILISSIMIKAIICQLLTQCLVVCNWWILSSRREFEIAIDIGICLNAC